MLTSVKELRTIKRAESPIPEKPGIYKWWANYETLQLFIGQINNAAKRYNVEIELTLDNLLPQLETITHDNSKYFCIYVGSAKRKRGLRDRIIRDHIKGNPRSSTLRKSIFSLKYGPYDSHNLQHKENNKTYVNEIIDSLYLKWLDLPKEKVDEIEIKEINSYLRIINVDTGDLRDQMYAFDPEFRHNLLKIINNARNNC